MSSGPPPKACAPRCAATRRPTPHPPLTGRRRRMLRDLRELGRHGLLRTLRDLVAGRPLSVLVHEHREVRYTSPPHPRRSVLAVVTIALAAVVATLGATRRQRTLPADVTYV